MTSGCGTGGAGASGGCTGGGCSGVGTGSGLFINMWLEDGGERGGVAGAVVVCFVTGGEERGLDLGVGSGVLIRFVPVGV